MSTPSDAARQEPACVLRLLSKLDQVAQSTEDALPVGPYLVDALIDDVDQCPALGQENGQRTEGALATALREAQLAFGLVRACPSMQREWAVARLRSAVDQAREVLEARKAVVLAECSGGDARTALKSAFRGERCRTCPFA